MTSAKILSNRLILFVAIACVCDSLIVVPARSAAAERLRVGVNLTTIETLPIYMAADAPSGEAIELSGGAIPSLTAGKVDVATNAETQAILRSVVDPDIRVILTVAEYSYRIIARRAAGIHTVSDLRGKRIATALNSSAHFYIAKVLHSVGLSETDVAVVGMPQFEMPAALARGDVDAVSIWEPAAEQSAEAVGSDAVILRGPLYRERFNLNTTIRIAADPIRRAAIVELLRSIIRTSREVRDNPELAQPLIAAKLDLSQHVVSTTWSLFDFPASIPDDLLETMIEQEAWMAEKLNRPPRSPQAIAALIDASLWQEAKASH
jgi:sulfonate transport system substrate-binding protein